MDNQDVIDFYNNFLVRLEKDQVIKNPRHLHVKKSFQKFINAGEKVLDLACGIGLTTAMLREMGCSAVGVDFAPKLISHAKKSYGGKFLCSDILELDLGEKYDSIVLVDCLEHLPPNRYLKIYDTIEKHAKHDTKVYINLPFYLFAEYCSKKSPDLQQIIDEAIPPINIVENMGKLGFDLLYLNTYGLDCEYQYVEMFFMRLSEAIKEEAWKILLKD